MDSITHTLFGLTSYGAVEKSEKAKPLKQALLFSALVGSQIPDIDVVINLTEVGRINQQMWHRGLTHSFFMAPVFATIIYVICQLIWKVKDRLLFIFALINVLIHIISDSLNTWGTGLLEPLFPFRISFGTLSIVDFVIWGIILIGFLVTRIRKHIHSYKVYRVVWIIIGLHITIQSIQGYYIYKKASPNFDQVALKSEFVPWHFTVIGKKQENVEIIRASLWSGLETKEILTSAHNVDLQTLFEKNPRAEVLMNWSPFVVVVDNGERIGIYDPRFYNNGESFLYEYILKVD